jgi:catechol 2,3-dioxygenase-like lactoylglutathione lyase family enzyme
MTENLAWDHTMINVLDVDEQIRRFAEHGIKFARGGKHEVWGTENALGYFGLNYIELISVFDELLAASFPRDNASAVYDAAQDHRDRIERINTLAIRTHDIEETHQRLKAAGIPVGDIVDGRRLDEQGHEIRWSIFFVNGSINGLPYPFFLQWPGTDQEREVQLVQQGLIVEHPGGNLRVHRAIFEVPDVLATAEVWSLITNKTVQPQEDDGAVIDLCDRELVFRTGRANRITELEFTGAQGDLRGRTISIGDSALRFV